MKGTLLLFAICLTTLVSSGQDRSEGLRKWSSDRDEARIITRDVMRQVNREIDQNIRRQIRIESHSWRGARGNTRYWTRRPYYRDGRDIRQQIRDDIRREIRINRDVIRNEIRQALRFWRY